MTTTDTLRHRKPSVITASRVLVAALVLVVPVSAIGAVFAVRASTNTGALVTKDDIAGCKSLYRVPFDDAIADLFVVLSDAVTTDEAAFLAAITAKDAAVKRVNRTSDDYVAAVELSVSDPAAFVRQCKERNR